jgi:PPOX class probable F420-dependent enzyme
MLTDEDRAMLRAPNFAVLSTLMPDGSPQASIVWITTDGDDILVDTAEGRAKPRNVRLDPRVVVTAWDRDDPYEQLIVRGRVIEVTHDGAEDAIDELSRSYTGTFPYPWRAPGEKRVLLRIRAESIVR